ncbi:MAG: GNAT family N-acetyltransferase [Nanoarchaeota archaeon]|nr:GNAT family N-acetyltransferase [Nanoarchaeota archaeon]
MKIRKANLNDLRSIVKLEKLWIKEKISWGLKLTPEKDLEKSLSKEIWYVAEQDTKIIAYANAEIILSTRYMTSLDVKKGQCFGDLKSVYVIKKYRNKGIGSLLIKKCLDDMKKEKVKIIRLRAVSKNLLELIEYYHQFGFKERTANMILKI